MKKLILILWSLGLWGTMNGQVIDDFKDGDFTTNPIWTGDDSLFMINGNLQMQSKGTAGSSKDVSIVTASTQRNAGEWSCWLRFAMSPSSQNFCRYYLCSDQANLKGSLNGIYVQLGGSTGNTDSIGLYKQTGLNRTRLIGGRASTVAKTNNLVRLKILCDSIGTWQLFSDTSAQQNFVLEGSAFDNVFVGSFYSGFFVRFTSGNINNFYFDDVYIGAQRFDTIKPQVTSAAIAGVNKLSLSFSEPIGDPGLLNPLNYQLDQNRHPVQLTGAGSTISLSFQDSFLSGTQYQLRISGLTDNSMNVLKDTLIYFTFYTVHQNDVLISELMPDPDPVIGLPAAEFVEIYNNTKFPLQLKNWKIKDLSTIATLPDFVIEPDSFAIICESQVEGLFKVFGTTIGIAALPSLNNTSDQIFLLNEKGGLINSVSYELEYYHNAAKQNGGWSMELINPQRLCTGKANWQASADITGGTPGRINSCWQVSKDTAAPQLISVEPVNANELELVFDEVIDSLLSKTQLSIQLNQSIVVDGVRYSSSQSLIAELHAPLMHRQTYHLQINNAFDCSGNQENQSRDFTFMEERAPKQNQLLINEIMFAPSAATAMPNAEFIELYNASSYTINLRDFMLSDGSSRAIFPDVMIYPDSFLLVCGTSNKPFLEAFGRTVSVTNFPSLSSDETLTLYNDKGYVLHQVIYNDSYLNNKMKQQFGGWTIELKDAGNPCGHAGNWESSLSPSGGTPGRVNSRKQAIPDKTEPGLLRVYPLDSNRLRCYFTESIDSMSAAHLSNLKINSQSPIAYRYAGTALSELEFTFSKAFDSNKVIEITIDSLQDCAANSIGTENTAAFGMPQPADSGDLVINEILFNPGLNGNDFVELYNRSEKYIDLNPFLLARFDADLNPEEAVGLGGNGWLIAPHQFLAFTADKAVLTSSYVTRNPKQVAEYKLPSMNDDEGSVILMDSNGKVMDQLIYTDKMHFELLDNKEGVSLERISPNRATNDASNWTSASGSCGYATPTYRNSQYTETRQKGNFNIEPEVFSPDGDGYKDILTFSYQLTGNSNVGKIEIYNSSGSLIKHVCTNFYMGPTGVISWNGITDKGEKALTGIYIANFEVFNLQGEILQFQKTFAVGGK